MCSVIPPEETATGTSLRVRGEEGKEKIAMIKDKRNIAKLKWTILIRSCLGCILMPDIKKKLKGSIV